MRAIAVGLGLLQAYRSSVNQASLVEECKLHASNLLQAFTYFVHKVSSVAWRKSMKP